jgi:prepilin-type N-terminal cleavage/methylation domain-containing protein
MTSRSSGFTLIELLVVVAILGILSAIGTLAYNGYVGSAKKSSTKNIMQQVALAQSEEYSMTGEYWVNGSTCTASAISSGQVETALFEGKDIIETELGFNICIYGTTSDFTVKADNGSGCVLTLARNDSVDESAC